MFTTQGAKILDGRPHYLVIEELGEVESLKHFEEILYEMKRYVKEQEIQSVSIILNEKEAIHPQYSGILEAFGYQKQETQYFYKRNLASFKDFEMEAALEIKSLEQTTSDVFKKAWAEASGGSLNASNPFSSLSIEKEFEGMKTELGPDYKKSCLVIFHEKKPIGVTMPQIEPGTIDEGRLFYFGILPAYRNKGWGETLHILSLHLLKKMGATYYIGATGHKNIPMQRIFQANGCEMIERKYIYKLKGTVNES